MNTRTIYSDFIEIYINGKPIISSSKIIINTGVKYFVMGNNGVGKTTLLKHIYNQIYDREDILMIDQDIELENINQTIEEFILYADIELYERIKKMLELEKKEMTDEEFILYNQYAEYCYQKNSDKYIAEAKKILYGLGFRDFSIKVSILSGGWRMRLALGKALLRKPDILILDEPTNHLDLHAVIWLTDYLKIYSKTLIIISHQIAFVNDLSEIILYVGNPELKISNSVYTIKGTYDKLLQFLETIKKENIKNYDKFQNKIQELKNKSTPKIKIDEFIKKNNVIRPPKPYKVNIIFDEVVQFSKKNIIELKNITFRYNNNEIYKNLELSLDMGTRMILVGENGTGKTTFLKLISLELKPTEGYIYYDERIRIGYYNQQILENLPIELTPIEYLQELNSKLTISDCRNILGKISIKKTDLGDLPMTKIKYLSGGQKARVSFAKLQLSNAHLILLDEPTNHLDIESIDGLIEGINSFNGGVVIITHDIYFIENIKNYVLYNIYNKNIKPFQGDIMNYCQYILNY